RRGTHHLPVAEGDTVTLAYDGLDDRRYETALTFYPTPTELDTTTMVFRSRVEALGQCVLSARVTARTVEAGAQVAAGSPPRRPTRRRRSRAPSTRTGSGCRWRPRSTAI